MTDQLVIRAEEHNYQQLFIQDLNWSRPDHPPLTYAEDGHNITATNVSSYKGLRVWVIDQKPESKLEAALDRLIAKTSTDRLVIFHDDTEQVWRWPVRRTTGSTISTRLSRHRHHTGDPDQKFAAKLAAIRLPFDVSLDANAVLVKVRSAFDVEAHNETRYASKLMARLYTAMDKAYPEGVHRKVRDHQISVTLARILFLMFADDTDMWRQDLFRDYIHEHTAPDGCNIGERLTVLFDYLDTPPAERTTAPFELKGFRYVNGGIFRERFRLPVINAEFRTVILEACDRDWATISPAIFGSMFQSVRDAATRRELGEHYTSEENILKTLNPLFLDELRAEFEHVKTLGKYEADRLRKLRDKLGKIRYMDPACGCGNFIIVAYRELRDLELAIMERLQEINRDDAMLIANVGLRVTLDHFYGIEVDEWPARIAETAMFLIDRQCDLKLTASLGWAPDRLPIQEQATIVVGNALRLDWASVCPPSADVIVAGNPPFVGHKERTPEQGLDLRSVWGATPIGHLDYVTGWYVKALDYLRHADGTWAFVSTNSVSQGEGVPVLFRRIYAEGWRLKFAHRTFLWTSEASGAAAVMCVILGFTKQEGTARLFDYPNPRAQPRERSVGMLNAYLVDGPHVLVVPRRGCPLAPSLPSIDAGSTPIDWDNFTIDDGQLADIRKDPYASKYLRRYVGGKELINGISRWCLWMSDAENIADDLARSAELRNRVENVRNMRLASERAATRRLAASSHSFGEIRQPKGPYLGIPQTFSENRPYATAARLDESVIASVKLFTCEDRDGLVFAVISSAMFMVWQKTVGGRLKSDPSFSSSIVWNNLPLPDLDYELRARLVAAGRGVEDARKLFPDWTLADLYRPDAMPSELRSAHQALDSIVDRAFGASSGSLSFADRQRVLFQRYEELTAPLFAGPHTKPSS